MKTQGKVQKNLPRTVYLKKRAGATLQELSHINSVIWPSELWSRSNWDGDLGVRGEGVGAERHER